LAAWNKDRLSKRWVVIWNLDSFGEPMNLFVMKDGINRGAIIIWIPLAYASRTEGPVCEETSKQIAKHVTEGK
jgi:hypothetical protein